METTLLTTKLNIPPPRLQLVSRPRLMERLEAALNHSLTLISAPAGFGKTTLLSEWVRQDKSPACVAWVSLDQDDNDPIRFWDYFIAALKTLQSRIGGAALSSLHSPQPPPIESTLTILINEITPFPEVFILVLDDYHFIRSQPVHTGITFLLKHLPPGMHLVIATRKDPPLPLSHFRGRGTMLEIRADDLRFTTEETVSLFKELGAPTMSSEDVKAVHDRAEGWAVGLKMAVLSIRRQPDAGRFLADFTGSQRYIMDYLMEEVFKQQSDQMKDFLLKTSVLERLTAPLCDTITGRIDSQDILTKLENDNLFIVPLDESRRWYRYEHLFGDLLRHRLEITSGGATFAELHRKASRWYEELKSPEDAIHHALAAQDWERSMKLISDPAVLGLRSRTLTMYNWLRLIPEEILRTDKTLFMHYIWVLESLGEYESAEKHLEYLEQVAPEDKRIQGWVATARANIAADKGDIPLAEEYAKKALSLLPPDDADTRAIASLDLGVIYTSRNQFNEAEPLLTEAYETLRRGHNAPHAAYPLVYLGLIALIKGKLRQAENVFNEVIEKSEHHLQARCMAHLYLGSVYREWNDLEKAALEEERAIELIQLTRGQGLDTSYLQLAHIRVAQGDIERAARALEQADRILNEREASPSDRALNTAHHVLLALAQEDPDAISELVDRLSQYEAFLPIYTPAVAAHLLFSWKGRTAGIERRQVYEQFKAAGLKYAVIAILLFQALDAPAPNLAISFLGEALSVAKPEGYIRIFVDFGMPLVPLLKQAIAQKIEPEYARKLLTIIEAEEERRKLRNIPSTQNILSERELEVLKLIAGGLSNQQIADKLFISLHTAKVHVHHILDKLDARGRSQAISRARELKLL